MKYFIPTYEQAKEIVNFNDSFFETVYYIDGFKISIFNYRIASYSDFIKPIKDKNYNALELRGLTYVFNKDGSLFNTYIMLNKFWNVNQVEETSVDKLKNKKIKSVYNKEDGSLITFIKLPNGKIVAKTKNSFDNDQAMSANEILLKNPSIFNFVKENLDKNIVTFWEYVSFKNKIVLDYKNTDLILLKVRNNITGEYIDIEQFKNLGFTVVDRISIPFDIYHIMNWLNDVTGIEGVVITFEDDMLVKAKSKWYFEKHKLMTEITNKENYIIEMVLNETIDDLKSMFDVNTDIERLMWLENIEKKVKKFIFEKVKIVEKLMSEYDGDIKKFAIKYNKDKNFNIAINVLKGKQDVYSSVKNWLLSKTKKLEQAKSFVNNPDSYLYM